MIISDENLRQFRKDFTAAVAPLQDKYDVTISLGSITYGENRFSGKMSVKNGRDKEDIAIADFDADVWRYEHLGLGPGMYNRVFKGPDGELYAIQGFYTRAKKYPLIVFNIRTRERGRAGEGFIVKLLDEYYVDAEVIGESERGD